MLTGVHFLLTYKCSFECDHCFLYCSPRAEGTFTLEQIETAMHELVRTGTVKRVYLEGGEPFLFYPLMVESARMARSMGFEVGVITNSYWATTEKDAEIWLRPLAELGIADLSLSDDAFHFGDEETSLVQHALAAAKKLDKLIVVGS